MKKILILVFLIIISFNACENKDSITKKEITIGMLLPLTGNGALYGKYVREGALLAIKELNTTKYKVVIEDTKTTVKDGVFALNKLMLKDNVSIVMGPMSSSVANTVGKVCQSKKLLMITTASAPNISNLGNYVYRIYPSDSYDGHFLAQKVIEKKRLNSIIVYLNNDFGIGFTEAFTQNYERQNGKIVNKFSFEANQQDFSVLVNKLKKEDFDNLIIIATQKEYINILNKMESINIKNVPIFAPVNIEDKVVKNAIPSRFLDLIEYSKPVFDLEKNNSDIQNNFKKIWSQTYKEKPNMFNAYGYDLVKLINKIILNTEDKNYKITLDSFSQINGVTGMYKFDKNGDVIREFVLLKLKDL